MMEDLSKELTNVVLNFTAEMNRMECDIRDKSMQNADDKTDWFLEFEKQYLLLCHKYCTTKKRVYRRAGYSLAEPYYYGIDVSKDICTDLQNDKQAQITFRFNSRSMGEVQYLFVLFKKKEGWRIDNVKRWSGWKKKWVSHVL